MKKAKILEDIAIATIVLTRIPINSIFSIDQNIEVHRGQWAYPVIGALIGFFLFLTIFLFDIFGVPHQAAIVISLSIGIFLTGALHEDGVADFFDSLGGKDYAARQNILKDSRLGSFGVLALIIPLMLKFLLLSELEYPLDLACSLISCSCLGRFSILLLVNYSDLSKQAGLTKHLKKVDTKTLILCGLFSILWVIPAGLFMMIFIIIFGYAFIYFFLKFIIPFNRGLSGDLIGLCVVLTELFTLLILTTSFS